MIRPQLATLAAAPPVGDEWLHEITWDGYRMILTIGDGRARLFSRNGYDYSRRAPPVVAEAAALAADAVLDGELVVLRADGRADFEALQRAMRARAPARDLSYVAWDLLRLEGVDLMARPLLERKRALRRLLGGRRGPIRYADHIVGHGDDVYRAACELGAEGIVSKLASARYQPGKRTRTWLKVKCWREESFLVIGWTEQTSHDYPFGALLLARPDAAGEPAFAGRVSLGFSSAQADRIRSLLAPARTPVPPVPGPLPGRLATEASWTLPEFIARGRYLEITRGGHLRHATVREVVPRRRSAA